MAAVLSDITNPFNIDDVVFYGIPSAATLYVPKGTKALYQTRNGWDRFTIKESEFEVNGIFFSYHFKYPLHPL